MIVKELSIETIKMYEKNPRKNEKAVDAVSYSIEQFGFRVPLVIDRENVIICGHTRLKAAMKLGMKTVPCVIADDLTEDQIKAYRLADNKTNELAEWDFDKLNEELKDLTAFDMDQFGFDTLPDLMDELESGKEEDDFVSLSEAEPKVKTGDIWQLGKHRLICGDCTDVLTIERLMDGKKANLLVTDPPYNVAVENSEGMTIQNDNMSNNDFYKFLTDAFLVADMHMKPGAGFYIWYGETEGMNFRNACNTVNWDIRQCIIWVKNAATIGRQDYQWKHEPCLYGWKPGASHYFIKNRKQQTVIDNETQVDFMTEDELKRYIKDLIGPASILREDKPTKNGMHPTMKPIPLIKKQVKNSTRKGHLVLDIFGGSGTTLLACEELDRVCYTSELDEKYASVIVERWEQLTGKTAQKLS